jgi:hypothetical protein
MSDAKISRAEIEKQFHDAKATISVKGNPFRSYAVGRVFLSVPS